LIFFRVIIAYAQKHITFLPASFP